MRINSLTPPGQLPGGPQGAKGTQQGAKGPAAAAGSGAAPVSHASLEGSMDIDMARVNELRQAISEGRLKMDVHKVADSLIASTRDLLGDS